MKNDSHMCHKWRTCRQWQKPIFANHPVKRDNSMGKMGVPQAFPSVTESSKANGQFLPSPPFPLHKHDEKGNKTAIAQAGDAVIYSTSQKLFASTP